MISAPDDYGLSAQQTLAHSLDADDAATVMEAFASHWEAFRESVEALPVRWHGSIDSPINQVILRSLNSVRVVARVVMPEHTNDVAGIVVTSHGCMETGEDFSDDSEPWLSLPVVVVRVRVRGYPPSTIDIPDLRADWILHQLPITCANADAWIVRGAVADIMQAVRCARSHFGFDVPVTLHGESLGAGLAVMAGAQLSCLQQPPQRLILEHPSLGDWPWRALRTCNGAGGRVNMLIDVLRGEQRAHFINGLMLYDSAIHASEVHVPVLVKLAQLDDVVPAPSAASVFNALQSKDKWRFITRYGHFDGGIANARRHLEFNQIRTRFADPAMSPPSIMLPFAARLDLPAIGEKNAVRGAAC